jgi:hypothetical protein
MSLANDDFELSGTGFGPVSNGTSILLTGDDPDALEAVFYQLVAGRDDEHSVVLGTDCSGRDVVRGLNDVERGAGDRARVLTCEGPDRGDNVTKVSDLTDLTGLGMQFSTEIAEAQTAGGRFRAGILLCSSILGAVEDTRSVYRFLNSNFLNHFRRGDAIGVCAVDTSADFGAGTSSTVKGLETSFSARIDVVESSRREATLDVSGLDGHDGQHTLSL